ncbi:MAG: hypothetical protein FWG80_01145 [Alphaproteobacteria bacterium]|nr:hypothetical protein [Alphaproteobacteria bacterium]
MKNKKVLLAATAALLTGIIIGACAMIPVAHYQYKKRGEVAFYLDAIVSFVDKSPECRLALEQL